MEDYVYEPVDEVAFEVRFLILLPGEREDPVQGLLLSNPLTEEQHLTYEGISYAWGSPDDPMDIAIRTTDLDEFNSIFDGAPASDHKSVDHSRKSILPMFRNRFSASTKSFKRKGFGKRSDQKDTRLHQIASTFKYSQQTFGKVSVTQNLGRALPYLRDRVKPRTLWIDAICVNQKDLVERSSQVQRMADIYRLASRSVVWLGEESDNSEMAFQYLERLSSKIEQDLATEGLSFNPKEIHNILRTSKPDPLAYKHDFMFALANLLRRPWFHRLWIWQEIQLASETSVLVCGGNNLILWNRFCTAITLIFMGGVAQTPDAQLNEFLLLIMKVYQLCVQLPGSDFDVLIRATKSSQCSDPKDRIYALLSLAGTSRIAIKPDYTKSIESIFQEAFVSIMHTTNSIDLLNLCAHRSSRPNMPSWVPDFSMPKLTNSIPFLVVHSSLDQLPKIGETLSTKGIQVSTLQRIWEVGIDHPLNEIETMKKMLNLLSKIQGEAQSSAWDGKLPEVFIRTMCMCYFSENYHPTDSHFSSISTVEEFLKYTGAYDWNAEEELSDDLKRLLRRVHYNLIGRNVFVTADGHLGSSSVFAKLGDIVVLLVGCRRPLILRPTENGQYLVVGEAYCHGIMYGEPFLGPLPLEIDALWGLDSSWPYFRNLETGEILCEDPRLGELPPGWSRIEHEESLEYSIFYEEETKRQFFSTAFDPRTLPKELEKRGVKLESFELA